MVYLKSVLAGLCLLGLAAPAVAQEREPGARIAVMPKPQQKRMNPPLTAPEAPPAPQAKPSAPTPVTPPAVKTTSMTPPPALGPARVNASPVAQPTGEIAPSIDMIDTPARPVTVAAQDVGPVGPAQSSGAYGERVELARQMLEVDGTEAIIRHFVGEVHMRLIVGEVGKYIDFNGLSESDRYRLATIVATVSTDLGDKILLLTARGHAQNLSKEELLYLARVNDTDAQRKLTQMRIDDTGELDKNAELIMQISALKIVQEFEKP
ncbi:hypothetical protein [Asticcacaulis sp. AND118]|uniref:hypothetical protein n=1 Tax=Asticcacaulis sp. AND118 TaxID=2840468 RepID=UPI001CFFB592|nr:hypothetical protein [Asticcacaulis sp. AND118]UDF03894.1 hypothetical protein LH365_02305 [Asticcacaulis sp. AND118]